MSIDDLRVGAMPTKIYALGRKKIINMYIYIITHPKFKSWIKIGKATNVTKRLRCYQTCCPFRQFKLEYFTKSKYPDKIESYFSNNFKNNGYEWYKCTVNKAIKIIESSNLLENYNIKNKNRQAKALKYIYKIENNTFNTLEEVSIYLNIPIKKLGRLYIKGPCSMKYNDKEILKLAL